MPKKQDNLYKYEFRAYDEDAHRMLVWENMDDRKVICQAIYGASPRPRLCLTQWVGQFDDATTPRKIYAGDLVEATILNDFGSARKLIGIVKYDLSVTSYNVEYGTELNEFEYTTDLIVLGDIWRNRAMYEEFMGANKPPESK